MQQTILTNDEPGKAWHWVIPEVFVADDLVTEAAVANGADVVAEVAVSNGAVVVAEVAVANGADVFAEAAMVADIVEEWFSFTGMLYFWVNFETEACRFSSRFKTSSWRLSRFAKGVVPGAEPCKDINNYMTDTRINPLDTDTNTIPAWRWSVQPSIDKFMTKSCIQ